MLLFYLFLFIQSTLPRQFNREHRLPNMHRKFNALGYVFTRMNARVVYEDARGETIGGRRAA